MKEFVKENNNLIGKGKEKNYYIMCLINFLHGLIFFGAITTIFRTQRGLSLEEMIIMESVFIVSIVIFEIPLGIIADKFGHSKTIMIGCFLLFISRIMFYNAYTFIAFLAQRFIVGIGIAAMSGCDSAIIYEAVEEEDRQKAISLFIGSLLVASAGLIFTKSKIASVLLIVLAKFSFSMLSPIIMDIENNSIKVESENRATILSAYSMISGIIEVGLSF